MSRASYARSGVGSNISKAAVARGTIEKMIVKPAAQPSVSSNIPGAASQGVPSADTADMGDMSRAGGNIEPSKVVAAQRGEVAYGPAVVASVARTGGQVRVAPGQFGVWAKPMNILSDRK
jgi:hypothetical protein